MIPETPISENELNALERAALDGGTLGVTGVPNLTLRSLISLARQAQSQIELLRFELAKYEGEFM